jgi:hypothetical protein
MPITYKAASCNTLNVDPSFIGPAMAVYYFGDDAEWTALYRKIGAWPWVRVFGPVTDYGFGIDYLDNFSAFVVGDQPAVVPLIVAPEMNDTFVYTPASTGISETFTMAPGTYATLDDVGAAAAEADGTMSDKFGDYVSVGDGGGGKLQMNAQVGGPSGNGDMISEGDGGARVLGFTAFPPNPFANGMNPTIGDLVLYMVCGGSYGEYPNGEKLAWVACDCLTEEAGGKPVNAVPIGTGTFTEGGVPSLDPGDWQDLNIFFDLPPTSYPTAAATPVSPGGPNTMVVTPAGGFGGWTVVNGNAFNVDPFFGDAEIPLVGQVGAWMMLDPDSTHDSLNVVLQVYTFIENYLTITGVVTHEWVYINGVGPLVTPFGFYSVPITCTVIPHDPAGPNLFPNDIVYVGNVFVLDRAGCVGIVPPTPVVPPATRIKPRDDNLALGAVRQTGIGNIPSSRQNSYRQGTRGTYS